MVSHIQCVLSVCGLVQTDCLTPGTGRETNAHRETVAGGLGLAGDEGRAGAGGDEAEDEEDTATALVPIGALGGAVQRSGFNLHSPFCSRTSEQRG